MSVRRASGLSASAIGGDVVRNPGRYGGALLVDYAYNLGYFDWIGKTRGTASWSNPTPSVLTVATVGSFGAGSASEVTNQSPSGIYIQGGTRALIIDAGPKYRLTATQMQIRQRNTSGYYHTDVEVFGSHDGSTWTSIGTGTSLNAGSDVWNTVTLTTTTAYRQFKILDTSASPYFCFGEVELFGWASFPNTP